MKMGYLKRVYTVCVTTFQMATLLAFNQSDLHSYRYRVAPSSTCLHHLFPHCEVISEVMSARLSTAPPSIPLSGLKQSKANRLVVCLASIIIIIRLNILWTSAFPSLLLPKLSATVHPAGRPGTVGDNPIACRQQAATVRRGRGMSTNTHAAFWTTSIIV